MRAKHEGLLVVLGANIAVAGFQVWLRQRYAKQAAADMAEIEAGMAQIDTRDAEMIANSEQHLKDMRDQSEQFKAELDRRNAELAEKQRLFSQEFSERELISNFYIESSLLVADSFHDDLPRDKAWRVVQDLYTKVERGVEPTGPNASRILSAELHMQRIKRMLDIDG